MRSLFLLVLFWVCVAQGQDTPMSYEETKVFTEAVITAARNTQSISSNFVQHKHLGFLDNDIETSGNMVFKAPNLIKWEYTKPYNYSVVFKNNQLHINDGGTKNTIDIGSSKMFKTINNLIINSVKGNVFDEAMFDISYFKTEQHNKVSLASKDKKLAEFILKFELLFDKKSHHVVQVKLMEPTGDFTRIVFKNRMLNPTLSDAVFSN